MLKLAASLALITSLLLTVVAPNAPHIEAQSLDDAVLSAGNVHDAHYIVLERDSSGAITPVFMRRVRLADPLASLSTSEVQTRMAAGERLSRALGVHLEDERGNVLFRGIAEAPAWLRGEFAGAHGDAPIEGHLFPVDVATFVVRVPVIADSVLRVADAAGGETAFDLDALAANPSIAPSGELAAPITPLSANRVDLLVMGDGYTAAEQAKFASDAATFMDGFFEITPYDEYRNYVNVTTLFTPSAQSGADHPPYDPSCVQGDFSCCADGSMQFDPLAGRFVATAFDGTFCAYNIHRLLVVNDSKVYIAASAIPDWDIIMLIVNDATYGGSGGPVSVISAHSLAVDIAQHEFGHSFTRLADEYDSPYPGFPPCSDVNTLLPACEANVTDQTSRNLIKWRYWILGSTPIPTPEGSSLYQHVVGLFLGARYKTSGMYRSGDECMMRFLSRPFCQVPSEAYVLRLYEGGWGMPVGGIRLIEPETEEPAGPIAVTTTPDAVTLSASLLQPVGAPPLDITWSIDGIEVPGEHAASFVFDIAAPGSYLVRLDVRDVTPLVHPSAPSAGALTHSRTWLVDVLVDTDSDGCSDDHEEGTDHVLGGQRDPGNFWDFFDVTGDHLIDFGDTLDVLAFFGDPGLPATPGDLRDRDIADANLWNTAESNGGVDLTDALASLGSFGDSCTGWPPV